MKTLLLLLSICYTIIAPAQQLYIIPNTSMVAAGFSTLYAKDVANSIVYYPQFNKFDLTRGVDFKYKNHKLSVSNFLFHTSFNLVVSTEDLQEEKIIYRYHGGANGVLIGYTYEKQTNILKQKKFKLRYGIGGAIGFNRTKEYYNDPNVNQIRFGFSGDRYFFYYEGFLHKLGPALFVTPIVGFDVYNKNKKPKLTIDLYYNIGLKPMLRTNLYLQYGRLQTSYFREENLKLQTRASSYGLKVGVPIKLLNITNKTK